MAERSEEAAATGRLHATIGGSTVELPVLKIRQARRWKAALEEADLDIDEVATEGGQASGELDKPIDVMLDLILAYDVTNALGGRDALEDRATDAEVYALFEDILAATFPFVARYPMTERFGRLVVASLYYRAKPTSGPSPTGDSPPTRSRKASPTSSSSSSGDADGSA